MRAATLFLAVFLATSAMAGGNRFQHVDPSFSIEHPDGWSIRRTASDVQFWNEDRSALCGVAWRDLSDEGFESVRSAREPARFAQWWEEHWSRLLAKKHGVMPQVTLRASHERPGGLVVAERRHDLGPRRSGKDIKWYLVDGSMGFVLTCETYRDRFARHEAVFRGVLESFVPQERSR